MLKHKIKTLLQRFPLSRELLYCNDLFDYYRNDNSTTKLSFFAKNILKTKVIVDDDKFSQLCSLIRKVGIEFTKNNNFLYSIDSFKKVYRKQQVLDNYSIDYTWVVQDYLGTQIDNIEDRAIKKNYSLIKKSLERYVLRLKNNTKFSSKYRSNLEEIESIFSRPAEHFHEAIQRILFVNQWLWQSGHKHNGFGHLDWILYDLYKKDIDDGYITNEDARSYIIDFFNVLHDKCWFKSTMLLGDTGQIIILGGLKEDGIYNCNKLTYLFIDVSKELKLPDPKVLLRVSKNMPDDLLKLAMECIATGIGAPFLSNDEVVIPSLIQFGYDREDAYNYVTSACWEPLIIGKSCDQNNIRTINLCEPFIRFLDSVNFEKCDNIQEVKAGYYKELNEYLDRFLAVNLDNKDFEEDPLITLFSPEILGTEKDVVRGGAKYANLGLTSVGMSTVVNSLLNIESFVFEKKQYTLQGINEMRLSNFEGKDEIVRVLNEGSEIFGNDSGRVISLTNEIMSVISKTMEKHKTKLGGKYKYGLSSPNYIVDATKIEATFDGRKAGQPFDVHISGKNGLPPTELISFASQLDYKGN